MRQPVDVEISGEVTDVRAPERIAFTYGFVRGMPIPPGGSHVTIHLEPNASGTLLTLIHEFADDKVRDEHVQGWRFQLSLLANAIANRSRESAVTGVDRWFSAWSDPDATTRERTLDEIASGEVQFRDRFSAVAGIDEVKAHLAAVHRFMPGLRIERHGDARHSQWNVLADWIARDRNGEERGRGTNLFVFDADGRIDQVVGFWAGQDRS